MGETRLIMAGSFIDGSGAGVRRNIFLTVKDSIITAIGSAAELPSVDPDTVEDFSHCTIVPPLVDCSVFLSRSPAVDKRVRAAAGEGGSSLFELHVRYCHSHGVLGVAESDESLGLSEKKYGGSDRQPIITIRKAGSDFFRICYSGNIDDGKVPKPRLTFKELRNIIGQKGGKKAVVVANGPQQVAEALEAGCDAIEQGYGMGEDNLRKMAAGNVLWIPGLLRARTALDLSGGGEVVGCRFSTRYVAPGKAEPGAETYWQKVLADQLSQLPLALELGVTTAVGTGAGSVGILHGESMVEEMKLFIRAGYSLADTIRCASENGARFFGLEDLGSLAVGRKATFLITRGTAQQLPRKLSYLEGIYIDGEPSPAYCKNPVRKA